MFFLTHFPPVSYKITFKFDATDSQLLRKSVRPYSDCQQLKYMLKLPMWVSTPYHLINHHFAPNYHW